jgi:asparagine synthase (glutamine-hydrolysing)
MCGIVGIVGEEPIAPDRLAGMLSTLRHRGPDDSGTWLSPGGEVALAQRRLSIIDLSPLGRNPMAWGGGRLWITYNGEVYNFRELRAELESQGCRFRSRTDSEVILAAYDRWGVGCLERFVGMFAFALWDSEKRRLFLARDRLGKKPLYYAERGGGLVFASELKALLADADFPREIDPDAISLYMRYGYVPAPYSIFRHARKLPPGHYALYEDGLLSVERYWDPVSISLSGKIELSEPEAEGRLEALLRDAVRHRMISDVPLGAFLSGGIDSSLVVALMQEESSRPVETFTVRFDDPQYNEADRAAAVARHLKTEHHEETCGVGSMLGILDLLPEYFDEPFADSSAVPTYLVSKIARRSVTVALSGDGGDELFFGYPRYSYHANQAWLLDSPRPVRHTAAWLASAIPRRRFQRAAEVLRQEENDAYSRFVGWWSPSDIETLTGHFALKNPVYAETRARLAALPPRERPPVLDLVSYLPEDILTKVDRASMAVSLETRNPLLDHRVVEFALRLPLRMKWRGGVTKWLLRRILYKKVPRELLDRPKMGFGVPLAGWLKGPLKERMGNYLSGHLLEELGLEPGRARGLWTDFLAGRSNQTELLWNLYALISWAERWRPQALRSYTRVCATIGAEDPPSTAPAERGNHHHRSM